MPNTTRIKNLTGLKLLKNLGEVPSIDEASENITLPETPEAPVADERSFPVPPRHRPTSNPIERWNRFDGRVRRTDRIIAKTFKVTPEFEEVLRDNCHRLNMTQIEVLEAALVEFNLKYQGSFVE